MKVKDGNQVFNRLTAFFDTEYKINKKIYPAAIAYSTSFCK